MKKSILIAVSLLFACLACIAQPNTTEKAFLSINSIANPNDRNPVAKLFQYIGSYPLNVLSKRFITRPPYQSDRYSLSTILITIDSSGKIITGKKIHSDFDSLTNLLHHYVTHMDPALLLPFSKGRSQTSIFFSFFVSPLGSDAEEISKYEKVSALYRNYAQLLGISNYETFTYTSTFIQRAHYEKEDDLEIYNGWLAYPVFDAKSIEKHPWLAKEEVFKPVNVKFDPKRD